MRTEEEIINLVADILGVSASELSPSTGVGDIPAWDSLAQVAIMTTLEDEYDLEWDADDILAISTLSDIISLVCRQQAPSSGEQAAPAAATAAAEEHPQCVPSLVTSILQSAMLHPAKTAIIFPSFSLTYHQLSAGIRAAASALKSMGGNRGDRVILCVEHRPEFFYTYFGAHLLGMAAVNLPPDINTERLSYITSRTAPAFAIGMRDGIPYDELLAHAGTPLPADTAPAEDDIADILFTTGTTGHPKGVLLTQANIAYAAQQINNVIGNKADDAEVLALPLYHSFGMGRVRCVLSLGGTLILSSGFTNTKRLMELLRDYRASGFSFVPAAWAYLQQMTGDSIAQFASTLRYIEIGSAPMAAEDKRHLMDLLPHTRICMHYGLTEASRSSFLEFHSEKEKLTSAGRPSPGVDIRIFSENGDVLPAGQEGEIGVNGPHVTPNYMGETAEEHRFGSYFRTGDWGMMDEDGYLYILSRTKDIINVGGKKVSPDEVERILLELPGVEDCACIAAADPQGILGEVVKAVCVQSPGHPSVSDSAIREYLTPRLEKFKHPAIIEWQASLPRTASGKLQRHKLN